MPDRLNKTVLLGSLLDPDTLFMTLPEPLRTRCRRAFAQGRAETMEQQARLGIAPPGLPREALRPFNGTAYLEGEPTQEYLDHWASYYNLPEAQEAQATARKHLQGYDE